MWRPILSSKPEALAPLLAVATMLVACEVSSPVPDETGANETLRNEVSSLDFNGETGRLRIRHRGGDAFAELDSVRLVIGPDRQEFRLALRSAERRGDALVLLCDPHPDHRIVLRFGLDATGDVRVELEDIVALRNELCELTLDYALTEFRNPDETWLPHRHPAPGQVCGDGSFHSPVAYVRRGDLAIALLPELAGLARHRRIPEALELDRNPTPTAPPRLRHGLVCQRSTAGGFERGEPTAVQGETLRFGHTLRMWKGADPQTLDGVFRELWRDAGFIANDALVSWDTYCRDFFPSAARLHWIELSRTTSTAEASTGGASGVSASVAGAFRSDLSSASETGTGTGTGSQDAWYSMRHQSLRTAYGLLLFGQRTEQPQLVAKAKHVLAHALTAPARSGMIPTVCRVDAASGTRRWQLGGHPDYYHAMDVASTCYWMLRLVEHFPEHREAVHGMCRRTARFFRVNQLEAGGFPSYYGEAYLAPRRDLLYGDSTETGSVARFLIEYAAATDDREALAAARSALALIETFVASGSFRDDESVRGGGPLLDPRSGVDREGTLGLIECALAAARMFQIEPEPRWRTLGERLLSRLCRYQQTWAPPWIPDAQIGGFGAGNFDARWNDSRQSLAALAFFAGHDMTGDPQWLERGIAALAAGLRTRATDHQPPAGTAAPLAELHWGPGSACTVAEIARSELGSAIVDLDRGFGYGIDAVYFEDSSAFENKQRFRLLTRARDVSEVTVRFLTTRQEAAPFALIVNGIDVGSFPVAELARGINLRPARVPDYRYEPPSEIAIGSEWRPRALPGKPPHEDHAARIEVIVADDPPRVLPLALSDGVLVAEESIVLHDKRPLGTEIRTKLLYDVAGRTYSLPSSGYRVARAGSYHLIDPGESDESELVPGHRSEIRRFPDGREFGRYADGSDSFTYRIPVAENANRIEFLVHVAGRIRVRAGQLVLHEDQNGQTPLHERTLNLELADHRIWSKGEISLTLEPVSANDAINVASIRYRASGTVASTEGLGATFAGRVPDQELQVLVLPLALIDRPLDVDKEALQLTFFGGPDHVLTPRPNSQRTSGSVAQFIEALSGGRTMFRGSVLPEQRWEVLAADSLKPDTPLPAAILRELRSHRKHIDLVIGVLGEGSVAGAPVPGSRSVDLGARQVPLVFLPARAADGSFLSCGTATTAVLDACYRTEPLRDPVHGNFGKLALSGTISHIPAGPAGINLTRTGWADHLSLERKNHEKIVISPLTTGRIGYVLDCNAIPGRGRLHLESVARVEGETEAGKPGMLLYWRFANERLFVRDLEQHSASVSILRVSATRNRTRTPFVPGGREDLFRDAATSLPADTLMGERLWEIQNYRPLSQGKATFDVRYLAEELLRAPDAQWRLWKSAEGDDPAGAVVPDVARPSANGRLIRVQLDPTAGSRTRLLCKGSPDLHRLFSRVRGTAGEVEVTIGADARTLATTKIDGATRALWLQTDLPPCKTTWLELVNTLGGPAAVSLYSLLRVPRVPPVHQIRPPKIETVPSVRLEDGVVYGSSMRLPAVGKKVGSLRTPIVLPTGELALRIRAGRHAGAKAGQEPEKEQQEVRITLRLFGSDGQERQILLNEQPIPRGRSLFLGMIEIPKEDADRVEFLRIDWTGSEDLYIVDLAIVRP